LRRLKEDIARQRRQRREDALKLVAEMLLDVAALRLSAPAEPERLEQTAEQLRALARKREDLTIDALLKRYNFGRRAIPRRQLPLTGARWDMDLFRPKTLEDVGLHVGKGMPAGAVPGATLDMYTAGISLGAATRIGAAAGGK